MNTTENNKIIAEFLPNYFVDVGGNIYNKEGSKLKTTTTKNGYERFNIGSPTKSFLVHRLVAENFIQNSDNKPEVNHIDGNKLNNNLSNLEWVTRSENIVHGFNNGLISKDKNNRGKNHFRAIPIKATDKQGNIIFTFESAGEAQRLNNFNKQSVRDAVRGKLKTYKGLYWSYNENAVKS